MKNTDFNNLLHEVEFSLTSEQRFDLFRFMYNEFSLDEIFKMENYMLKQINSHINNDADENKSIYKQVKQSCKILLQYNKNAN